MNCGWDGNSEESVGQPRGPVPKHKESAGIGAVVSPKGNHAIRNSLSYADSFDFGHVRRQFVPGTAVVRHRVRLKCGIQRDKNLMSRCGCRCILGCTSRCTVEADQVWLVRSINRVNRVIDCRVHDGKASGWMDGRRLSARCANDYEKISIPLDDWVHRLGGKAASSLR